MIRRCLLLCGAVSAALFAETVVKNSAPFSFPTTTGTAASRQVSGTAASFAGKSLGSAGRAVAFSWSLPSAAKQGVISVFRVDGSRVALLKISGPRGSMPWTAAANGIYCVTLRYGAYELDNTMVIYK